MLNLRSRGGSGGGDGGARRRTPRVGLFVVEGQLELGNDRFCVGQQRLVEPVHEVRHGGRPQMVLAHEHQLQLELEQRDHRSIAVATSSDDSPCLREHVSGISQRQDLLVGHVFLLPTQRE